MTIEENVNPPQTRRPAMQPGNVVVWSTDNIYGPLLPHRYFVVTEVYFDSYFAVKCELHSLCGEQFQVPWHPYYKQWVIRES